MKNIIDKTFVISRTKDIERRTFVKQQLDEISIDFEWFDAIDAHSTPLEYFHQNNIKMDENDIGSHGCALSHIQLLHKIVNENIKISLVIEDDCIFHEYFNNLAPKYYNVTPNNWGIIFLGFCCYYHPEPIDIVVEHYPLTTHCYMITHQAAKDILDNLGEVNQHIDIHFQKIYNSNIHKFNWRTYLWYNGFSKSKKQKTTRLGVYFSGLAYQEHDIPLAILNKN